MVTGGRFRELRDRVDVNQTQIAISVGMSQATWSDWENNPPKQLQWLENLGRRYQISIDYLLGLVDDPQGRRAVSEAEQRLLIAWQALTPEQQSILLELLRDGERLDVLLEASQALGALNRRLTPRIIGESASTESTT